MGWEFSPSKTVPSSIGVGIDQLSRVEERDSMAADRRGQNEPEWDQHWLIWDGECGFCRRVVVWFQRMDTERQFRVAPYQGTPSPPMTPQLREQAARAMQVITRDGRQISGGRSVLFVLETLGWYPVLMRVASKPPLVWLVEIGYRVVAANRRFFSRLLLRGQTDGPSC